MSRLQDQLQSILDENLLDETRFNEVRRQIFDDGNVQTEEADLLFRIDTDITDLPEGWDEFFVGALTDFLIRQTLPVGYIDPIHASWLMERLEQDDRLSEETELELLLNILRLARDVPESLEQYALAKARDRILARTPLMVTSSDVETLKKILYACGGSDGFSISEGEARFLFDLDEVTQSSANDPEWQRLFVGAIANHLMTIGAPAPLESKTARRGDEFLMSNETISWNLSRSFKSWLEQFRTGSNGSLRSQYLDEDRLAKAQTITFDEAGWLIDQINRDGSRSDNEQALLAFLKDECPNIHESLNSLLRYAA